VTLHDRLDALELTPEFWSRLLDHVKKDLTDPEQLPNLVAAFLWEHQHPADLDQVVILVGEVLTAQVDSATDQFQAMLRDWSI
jgi:hypothetical protein